SALRIGSMSPSCTSTASVTIITRRAPEFPIIAQRRMAESGPTNAAGRGIATTRETGHWSGFSARYARMRRSNHLVLASSGRVIASPAVALVRKDEEMSLRRRDRPLGALLPGLDPEVRHAPPVLRHDRARERVERSRRAEVRDRDVDRLRQDRARDAVHDLDDRRRL